MRCDSDADLCFACVEDIASYLGLAVRTTQRWEHDFGLPVHRPTERERTAVFAFPEEIDAWLHAAPVGLPQKLPVPAAKSNGCGVGGRYKWNCA